MDEYAEHVANWSVQEIRMRIRIAGQIIREATEELNELREERDKLTVVESPTETQSEQLALILERIDHLVNQGIPEVTRQAEELNQIRIAKNKAVRVEHGFEKPPDQVVGLNPIEMAGKVLSQGSSNGRLRSPVFQKIPIDPDVLHNRHSELSIREVAELSPDFNHQFEFVLICATCGFNNVVVGFPDVIVDCCDETCDSSGSYIRAAKIITTNKE